LTISLQLNAVKKALKYFAMWLVQKHAPVPTEEVRLGLE